MQRVVHHAGAVVHHLSGFVPRDRVHRPVHRGVRGEQRIQHHAVHTVADVRLVPDVGRIGGAVLVPVSLNLSIRRCRNGDGVIMVLVRREPSQHDIPLLDHQHTVVDAGTDGRRRVLNGLVQRRAVVVYPHRQRRAVLLHLRLETDQSEAVSCDPFRQSIVRCLQVGDGRLRIGYVRRDGLDAAAHRLDDLALINAVADVCKHRVQTLRQSDAVFGESGV